MQHSHKRALTFVVAMGVVSLLADVTYEGARSIVGPYLGTLGASATMVGVVAGAGELVGYAIRLFFGYLADRTRWYWRLIFVGYTINLLAVPALALAGRWEVAAVLVVMERLGKAVRAPSRDVVLSNASSHIGIGWGFGLHEAMDQIGAVTGPILMVLVVGASGAYRQGFATLLIPALAAIAMVGVARSVYPAPPESPRATYPGSIFRSYTRAYWMYMVGAGFIAAGYADFALLGFHLSKTGVVPAATIPLLYAVAMGADAVAALIFGRLFDRFGMPVLAFSALLAAPFAGLVLYGGMAGAIAGMVLWGIGMGAQESILRARIGTLVPQERRGTAYGMFNSVYGLAWFAGSAMMGLLYDYSIAALVAFSAGAQVVAAVVFLVMKTETKGE